MTPILAFFYKAYDFVSKTEYISEIEWCRKRPPFEMTDEYTFFVEYVWVVLNSGMKEQIVREKIFQPYIEGDLGCPEKYIRHPLKLKAVQEAILKYQQWFREVKKLKNDVERIEYLDTLPHIGKVTKFHLARNIGIDCVKPDRHLVRLAAQFKYATPLDMCQVIKSEVNEPLGVIEVVLWRFCALTHDYGATAFLQQTLLPDA